MSGELYYIDANGQRQDAALHDDIIGANIGPHPSSLEVARRVGLSDEEIAALFGHLPVHKDFDESKHPRDDHGRFADSDVDDPNRAMTPEEERARREERRRPENVSEYELRRVNYTVPRDGRWWADRFTSDEEFKNVGGAIRDYAHATGDGDAYAVNRALRGTEEMTPRLQQAVDNLDLAFARTGGPISDYHSKQPKDAWLYRGIDSRHPLDLKVGDEIRDPAFMSTSINKSFAQEWARHRGPGGSLVRITAPAGTKVLPILGPGDEGEVLLNRGTRLRVTGVNGRNFEMSVI